MGQEDTEFLEERTFLHDLSNQLIIAQGMSTLLLNTLAKNPQAGEKELDRLKKVLGSVDKIVELVKSRREVVKAAMLAGKK